jgi:D-alanyl-D-alanine carboxypeptidase
VNDGFRPLHALTNFTSRTLAGLALVAALADAPAHAGPYLLMDADNGRVIAESDAGRPWYPASVTKLMTTYLAFRAMREGKADPLTLLTVSENAQAQPPSKMGFKAGTTVTLDNAIKMLMVRSANDIAVVIAEGLGGSVQSFVHQMNETAGRLGMSGTRFLNPHGLPEEHQVTTARDMAVLARALIQEFPEYEMYFRIPAIQMGKSVIRNHNRLIDRYPGADGMKTGFICSSGFNVVAAAKRGGKRLIVVVFGSYSAAQRSEDAARLFERGFRRETTLAAFSDSEFGTLQAIRNLPGDPYDMRDEMCNPKRKRPAAESDIDDDEEGETTKAEDNKSGAVKEAKAKSQRPSLLGEWSPSMPPIRVYTGLPSKTPNEAVAATAEKPKTAAKPAKLEAKTAKTSDDKSVKEGDGAKPANAAKTEKPKPVQASASTAAAKPKAKDQPAQPKK